MKESCHRLVDIVKFVPFVREERIVSSTCRYREIRAIRARRKNYAIDLWNREIRVIRVRRKNRVIDLSISCHSCHSCEKKESCHRLVDIVPFMREERSCGGRCQQGCVLVVVSSASVYERYHCRQSFFLLLLLIPRILCKFAEKSERL